MPPIAPAKLFCVGTVPPQPSSFFRRCCRPMVDNGLVCSDRLRNKRFMTFVATARTTRYPSTPTPLSKVSGSLVFVTRSSHCRVGRLTRTWATIRKSARRIRPFSTFGPANSIAHTTQSVSSSTKGSDKRRGGRWPTAHRFLPDSAAPNRANVALFFLRPRVKVQDRFEPVSIYAVCTTDGGANGRRSSGSAKTGQTNAPSQVI